MSLIFLAFANDQDRPLIYLSQEDKEVYKSLSRGMNEDYYNLHRDSFTSLQEVARYLIEFRNSLTVFHYSGHAGRDTLLMDGQKVNGESIASLLGQCPNLKLIILNGCSTAGQVAKLLQLPNKPAVIATSAEVNDSAAMHFSVVFWQSFSQQCLTLEEAYTWGKAAANHIPGGPDRGIETLAMSTPDMTVWGLYVPKQNESIRHWTLPNERIVSYETVQPNDLLLKILPEKLAAYDANADRKLKEIQQYVLENRSEFPEDEEKEIRKSILIESFPSPISDQIRQLFSKDRGKKQIFYNKSSVYRLQQLLLVYQNTMELTAFILLAQLFDLLSPDPSDVHISRDQIDSINRFLAKPPGLSRLGVYFPMVSAVLQIFKEHGQSSFIPQLSDFGLDWSDDFRHAFEGLEKRKQRNLSWLADWQIKQECIDVERMLVCILSHLSFLADYTLDYVRNIKVLHNRILSPPEYLHRIIPLSTKNGKDQKFPNLLANESVQLHRKGEQRFLNLAPFIMDQNAYITKATIVKLCYFDHFNEEEQAYCFKHIYSLDEQLLSIKELQPRQLEEIVIKDIWDQFEGFRKCIQKAAS